MNEVEMYVKQVEDAIYLLERHGELKVHPGNMGDLATLWLEGADERTYVVASLRTERRY